MVKMLHIPLALMALCMNVWWFSRIRPFPISTSFSIPRVLLFSSALVLLLALCMKAAAPSTWFDHGLYYIQTMKWMQQYPMAPGLANLHNRLGFASAFHALQALFAQKWIPGASFDDLNELSLFWCLAGLAGRLYNSKNEINWFYLLVLILLPFISLEFLSSPSVDLLLIVLTLKLVAEILDKNPNYPVIWLLASFAVACKLSGIIVFVLPTALVLHRWESDKWDFFSGIWVVFIAAIIVLYKNIQLTGYPFFTFPMGGLQVDWVMPFDKVLETNQEVIGHARIKLSNADMLKGLTYPDVAKMSLMEWVPTWWQQRPISHVALIVALLLSSVFWLWRIVKRQVSTLESKVSMACVASLVYWFFTAPEPRFQYGLLLILPLMTLHILLGQTIKVHSPWLIPTMLFATTLAFLVMARDKRVVQHHMIEPARWGTVRTVNYTLKPGIRVYYPLPEPGEFYSSGQCWDADLPCTPYRVEWLEARGNTIEDGYRIKSK